MNGILIIDKPADMTSHDVVARVRRALKTKRVGHTGTLDPFATGVLVVVVGNATRLARFLEKDVKEYIAEVQFGVQTDTGDRTGTHTSQPLPASEVAAALNSVKWDELLTEFGGEQMQTPPMYSAKKVQGRKLYELARVGKEIERQAVPITVNELEVVDSSEIGAGRITMRIACSAGTYIRTLAEDIGRRIGTGAHLANLRRTAAGKFDLGRSITLEELDEQSTNVALLPIDYAVSGLREFVLMPERMEATRNGMSTRVAEGIYSNGEFLRMTNNGSVVAIGIYDESEKLIRPKVVLL